MLCDVSGLLQEETLVSRYLCVAPESDDQKRHYKLLFTKFNVSVQPITSGYLSLNTKLRNFINMLYFGNAVLCTTSSIVGPGVHNEN